MMSTRLRAGSVLGCLVVALVACAGTSSFVVQKEVTGLETNCYLVYDSKSKEAALIDVGGPVNALVARIAEQGLTVKYILLTHGHPDHIAGVSDIQRRFPKAELCLHQADFESLQLIQEWLIKEVGPVTPADIAENPEMARLLELDVSSFPIPDILIRDGDILKLGSLSIRVIHSPGHSPGSVCYQAGDILFSGDVLFHRSVGRVDLPNSSAEDQITSVRRLYSLLPDSTKVHPGHGEPTDIGSEKRENTEITMDMANP
jgi:glyoxylase-like metal-dependent hydrolase (beta-lactamase superfamily II)